MTKLGTPNAVEDLSVDPADGCAEGDGGQDDEPDGPAHVHGGDGDDGGGQSADGADGEVDLGDEEDGDDAEGDDPDG